MSTPEDYSFPRYLVAKKSADDRALNRQVWLTLARALPAATPQAPLKVLEVGAGVGTMVERMLEWGLLISAEYTAIDSQHENVTYALDRLPRWGAGQGYQVEHLSGGSLRLQRDDQIVTINFETTDLFDFLARDNRRQEWDLLVANAFLDLMDVQTTLPKLLSLLCKDGLYSFSLNFDGVTLLEPELDPELDELIQTLYHRTMDERVTDGRPSGDSRTGRHLFAHLMKAGAEILAAGSSDWVVFPGPSGYPQDEAYFLHFVLHTLQSALEGHPLLDGERFARWIAERHAQVERGELVYIAHQLDLVGRVK